VFFVRTLCTLCLISSFHHKVTRRMHEVTLRIFSIVNYQFVIIHFYINLRVCVMICWMLIIIFVKSLFFVFFFVFFVRTLCALCLISSFHHKVARRMQEVTLRIIINSQLYILYYIFDILPSIFDILSSQFKLLISFVLLLLLYQ